MSEPAAQTVRSLLHDLEERRQIKILFAVESGSRAWRIESADSDYDVRFVYCRPLKDYVSLARPDDVINAAFDQKLAPCTAHDALYDLCGFDIFKFLRLLAKSNLRPLSADLKRRLPRTGAAGTARFLPKKVLTTAL